MQNKNLILAIGNRLLGDDAVAFHVIEILRKKPLPDTDYLEVEEGGITLLDVLEGYRKCIIIDSIKTGDSEIGEIHVYSDILTRMPTSVSAHYTGLPEVIQIAKVLGEQMPEEIYVYAIEVADPYIIREGLSPELSSKLDSIAKKINELAMEFFNISTPEDS